MKKRIFTGLLAVGLLVSLLTVPAGAAETGRFSDVSDSYTATAVETLRLMGVLDGYADGTFRPGTILNRAQFCKMTVYAMDGSGELGRYSTVTIFPDVKPSHWASAYINMAAKKGIISGYADGTFQPGTTVTAGQAVTILMRGLGYKDENMGGVWPQSYMAEAKTSGLLSGTGITSAYAGLTRAQAAKLFLNLFETRRGDEKAMFSYTLSDEGYLTAVDGGKGTMTAGGKTYDMVNPVSETALIGSRGKVVLNAEGKALTFLPVTGSTGSSNAAIILSADKSTAGLDSLAGSNSYSIYKNGMPAVPADLRRNDVAVYSASTHSVLVCDTRVSVYYEDCDPSPSAPTTITVLNGTELNVLPTAVESLSKFKPGQQMILLLTVDGQVAGAMAADGAVRANALAVVSESGSLQMICGGALLSLSGSGSGYEGKVVSLSGVKNSSGGAKLALNAISGGASGTLDVQRGTLGSKSLAANVLIFDGGRQVALSELGQTVNEGRITYARINWAGEVDLVVLSNGLTGDLIYGRAVSVSNDDGSSRSISIETKGKTYGPVNSSNFVNTGDWVAVSMNKAGTMFTSFDTLKKLTGVSSSAWVGDTAVNAGGRSYEVPAEVQCYNADTHTWFSSLDAAKKYGGTMTLYLYDGIVRAVEVRG